MFLFSFYNMLFNVICISLPMIVLATAGFVSASFRYASKMWKEQFALKRRNSDI